MEQGLIETSSSRSDGGHSRENATSTVRLNPNLCEKDLFCPIRPDQAIVRTFQVFRHQQRVFFILAAVAWAPFFVMTILSQLSFLAVCSFIACANNEDNPLALAALAFCLFALFPMSTCISQVASIRATAEIYAGKQPHWKRLVELAYSSVSTRRMAIYWGFLGFACPILVPFCISRGLVTLYLVLTSEDGMVHLPREGGMEGLQDKFPVFLIICFTSCVVVFTTVLCLIYAAVVNPIMVLEDMPIFGAVNRALELFGGSSGRLDTLLALGLHVGILFVTGLIPGGVIVVPFLVPPLTNILFTIIYTNLRIKKEGFDRSDMLEQIKMSNSPPGATDDSKIPTIPARNVDLI